MQVTVVLKSCEDCRYCGHSGSFTVRGARQVCDHPDIVGIKMTTKEQFLKEYPEYKNKDLEHFEYHWIHRVLTPNSDDRVKGIPKWCPLKTGSGY